MGLRMQKFMHKLTFGAFVLALLTCGIPVFWMHFEANHCNAFALMLLTCGIPKLGMRSRQIFTTSLVAGLRIHVVWMRCKLLQLGRRNVYLLGYWPVADFVQLHPQHFASLSASAIYSVH